MELEEGKIGKRSIIWIGLIGIILVVSKKTKGYSANCYTARKE